MVFALLFIQLYRRYITFSRRNFALLRKHTATVNAIFLLLQNTVKPCILDIFLVKLKLLTNCELTTQGPLESNDCVIFTILSSSRVNCVLTREEKTSKKINFFLQKFTLTSFKYHNLLKNIILRRHIYIWAPSFFLSMHSTTVLKVRCCYITLYTGCPK